MSEPEFTIREATPEDLPALVALQVALAEETEHMTPDLTRLHDGVARLLRSPALGRYLVAVDGTGTLVGCLLHLVEWSTWQNAEVWWLYDVYVPPAWRQRGVFRALYAQVLAAVETDPHVLGIRLYVNRENARARRTYESLGMRDDHWALYEWMCPTRAS